MAKKHEKRMNNMEKELQIWDREHYPVMDKDGRAYIPEEGERFVPLFNYLKKDKHGNPAPKIDYRYRVSEKGEVLSFTKAAASKTGRPLWLTKNLSGSKGYKYYVVGDKWRVHELVWFSFAADAILNGGELPKHYNVVIDTYDDLVSLCKQESLVVHHIWREQLNNRLEGLFYTDQFTHLSILHRIANMSDDERLTFINENIPNGSIIFPGEAYKNGDLANPIKDDKFGLSIYDIKDPSELLTDEMKAQIEATYLHAFVHRIIADSLAQIGTSFFDKTRRIFLGTKPKVGCFETKKIDDETIVISSFDPSKYEECKYDITILPRQMDRVKQ